MTLLVKGETMKSVVALANNKQKVDGLSLRALALGLALGVLILLPCGCSSFHQPGESVAETNRRHKRVLRVNSEEMLADVDMVLMLDRPSHLSDSRLP